MSFLKLNNFKFYLVRSICSFFPPILTQIIRSKLLGVEEAQRADFNFKRESFTGGFLRGNSKDFHAFKFFIHGYYDWRNIVLVKSILKLRRGDIIEIGANIGTETVSLAALNKSHNVHAFEPVHYNFESLERLKFDNKFDNLKIYKLIVSDKSGTSAFKIPAISSSGSGHILKTSDVDSEIIEMVFLDDKLKNIQSCSAILADVEGFEYNVILGAQNIIKKYKPYLILEVNPTFFKSRTDFTLYALYNELCQLGYQPYIIGKIGLKKIVDIKQISNRSKNWICIPTEDINRAGYFSRSIFMNSINPLLYFKIF